MNKIKVKTNRSANNIVWVEAWAKQAHPSVMFEIGAEPIGNKWVCEFLIPTIDKKVKSTSSTEVGAMLSSARKARKIIENYLAEHPECKTKVDEYWSKNWEIQEDKEGNFLSLGRKSSIRKQEAMRQVKQLAAVRKAFKVALMKASKILGSTRGLNVQIIDKQLFSNDVDIEKIDQKAWHSYEETFGMDDLLPAWTTTEITDDNLVLIRYQNKGLNEDCHEATA